MHRFAEQDPRLAYFTDHHAAIGEQRLGLGLQGTVSYACGDRKRLCSTCGHTLRLPGIIVDKSKRVE